MDYTREQLRQTQQLIATQPTQLMLRRKTASSRTAAGGRSSGDGWSVQQAQTVFFGAKTRDDLPMQDTQGERVIQYYTVVGMPDLDIQNGDMFTINGIDCVVVYVHRNLAYEVKADVESFHGGR